MKTRNMLALTVAALAAFTLAGCGSGVRTLSLAPVTGSGNGNAASRGVALYFGDQPHPAVQREIGMVKSGAHVGRQENDGDGLTTCNQALGQALDKLRNDARRKGANAVINISTDFHARLNTSANEYVCGVSHGAVAMHVQGLAVVTTRE